MKRWIIYISLLFPHLLYAQDSSNAIIVDSSAILLQVGHIQKKIPDSVNKHRLYLITGIHATSYAATLVLLGQAWYKDYPQTSFHSFNDSKEWLQLDKVGHGWTAYNLAKYSKGLWQWTGLSAKKSAWLGGMSSMGYQTILEFLDAYSAEWGWSWIDMSANIAGTGMYVSQELIWKEQRIQFKFSSHRIQYDESLKNRADELYGSSLPKRLLKDYNAQTYWLSFNIKSFNMQSSVPPWLNLALGYGAEGLFGGFENIGFDKNGTMNFYRPDIKRVRQWYLAPDIDFTKIKTNKIVVKSIFSFLNMLKFPAPALEVKGGKLKGRLLVF